MNIDTIKIYFARAARRVGLNVLLLLFAVSAVCGSYGLPEIVYAGEIAITPEYLSYGAAGEEYEQQLAASGGEEPYVFSLAPGSRALPAGLDISESGMISGTPAESGAFFNIVIQVRDNAGNVAEKAYRMDIDAFPVNFRLSDNEHTYDGTAKTAVAPPFNAPEPLVQDVDYRLLYGGREEAIEAGAYGIKIQFINPKYICGIIQNRSFNILPSPECSITLEEKTVPYNGEAQPLIPMVEPSGLKSKVTYMGTDGTSYSKTEQAPSAPGKYLVTAQLTEKNYEQKSASAVLRIQGIPVTFSISGNGAVYSGSPHKAVVTPSVPGLNEGADYVVTYDDDATAETERLDEVIEAGTYSINIELKNNRYEMAAGVLPKMTVTKRSVDFTVDNASVYYDAASPGKEYAAGVRMAPGSPALTEDGYEAGVHDGKGDYYVTYTNQETSAARDGSVTIPGNWRIGVVFNNPNYTLGVLGEEVFHLVERSKLTFKVSDNIYDYAKGVQRTATVKPLAPYETFSDYTVTYDDKSTTDVVETLSSAEKAGRYEVHVTLGAGAIDAGYMIANPIPGVLDIERKRINFTVNDWQGDYWLDPAEPAQSIVLSLSANSAEVSAADYAVKYSSVIGGMKFDAITTPGKYNIIVEFQGDAARNYLPGDITPRAWLEVKNKGSISLSAGNSAAGLIASAAEWDDSAKADALAAFRASGEISGIYSFADGLTPAAAAAFGDSVAKRGYNKAAWSDYSTVYGADFNADLDGSAIFAAGLSDIAEKLALSGAHGAIARDTDGSDASGGIKVKIKGLRTVAKSGADFPATLANSLRLVPPHVFAAALASAQHQGKISEKDYVPGSDEWTALINSGAQPAVGVYGVEYTFTDKAGHEIKALRRLICLGRAADVNMDGHVNNADAYQLRLWKAAEALSGVPSNVAALHYFRDCDVNYDGSITAAASETGYNAGDDASCIIHRFYR